MRTVAVAVAVALFAVAGNSCSDSSSRHRLVDTSPGVEPAVEVAPLVETDAAFEEKAACFFFFFFFLLFGLCR